MQAAKQKTLFLAAMLFTGITPLAAHTRTTENSRLGLDASQTSLHREIERGSSLNTLGIDADARQTCIRSRSTSKERDGETGLDYFLARYYSAAQGRFTSPDEWAGGIVDPFTGQQVGKPGPLPYADITDPQTINKYAYVRNNPLRYTDPDGHVIDTLADIAFIGYDIYDIAKNGATVTSVLALGADVVGAVVPFATGLGAGVRAAHAVEEGAHVAQGVRHAIAEGTVAELKAAGKTDAHHIIQNAAAKDLPGYNPGKAPGIQLPGPPTKAGTPHNATRAVQQQAGGGTYAAERRIGYKSLRKAGLTPEQARRQIKRADEYFESIGVTGDTVTRIPGDRR